MSTSAVYEVPFELRGGFLVVFEGRIAHLQNLKFVLDTGASYSVVDRKVAQRLSLRRHAGRVFSFDKS
jgi:predicted aspartyl protease